MNTPADSRAEPGSLLRLVRAELPLGVGIVSCVLAAVFARSWFAGLSGVVWPAILFFWLFVVIAWVAFAVVRHADGLALRLGEPYGTLVLTLSAIAIEVAVIAAVMLAEGGNATLGRDTMFAVLMIILNGLVGAALLAGGIRHHEQQFNLRSANAFLGVIIPLAVLGLVLPNFTQSAPGGSLTPLQSIFDIGMSIALYAVFLMVQTISHSTHFIMTIDEDQADDETELHAHGVRSVPFHGLFLVVYLIVIVFLAKKLAIPLDYGIMSLGAPSALGGVVVAVLILAPEGLSAIRAALANRMQRSVNILLGTVLSTIGLTVPAVLVIGLLTGEPVTLGLDPVNMTMLLLTLVTSILTFASGRTNVLQGAVHLILFVAYGVLIFEH